MQGIVSGRKGRRREPCAVTRGREMKEAGTGQGGRDVPPLDGSGGWRLGNPIRSQKAEVAAQNRDHPAGEGVAVPHQRRLTNLGTFRAYLAEYLRAHPGIHQEMIPMVRQLAPGPKGIPMEVHGFTNDIRWSAYEGIQGDLFDHILATIPDFGLRVCQKPSGSDLRQALEAR